MHDLLVPAPISSLPVHSQICKCRTDFEKLLKSDPSFDEFMCLNGLIMANFARRKMSKNE